MYRHKIAFCTLLFLSATLFASTWETYFHFKGDAGTKSSLISSGLDSNGNHWIAGITYKVEDGVSRSVWRALKASSGNDYKIEDEFTYEKGSYNLMYDISFGKNGTVYLPGYSQKVGSNPQGIVRSQISGKWQTLLDMSGMGYDNSVASSVVEYGTKIFVSSSANYKGQPRRFLILMADMKDLTNWQVIDTESAYDRSAGACLVESSGTLYAGIQYLSGQESGFKVRSSKDGGSTWTDAPLFSLSGGKFVVFGLGACKTDSKGRIYVSLTERSDNVNIGGYLFRSDSNGENFKLLDKFFPKKPVNVIPHGAFVSSIGTLFYSYQGVWDDIYGWEVRSSNDDGKTFVVSDNYLVSDTLRAGANTISEDSSGNILVGGYEEMSGEVPQAMVLRRLTP